MPLSPNALDLVRANLELLKEGERPRVISVGFLTAQQHAEINALREKEGKPPLEDPEILFLGRHFYESRSRDGYTIDDMLQMVSGALAEHSIAVAHPKMTGLLNETRRNDAYGGSVQDLAVLELYAKRPKAELFSVIPKGDRKPNTIQK
ncbi:hypothetical protein [Pseudoduganella sp. HUAS MS19]